MAKPVSRKSKGGSGIAVKKDPALWERSKKKAVKKMGGKWSARAAQLAVKYYKDAGGKFEGKKTGPSKNKLSRWTAEDWNYAGKRYLPKKVRKNLTKDEIRRTSAAKRRCTERGQQWCKQPRDVAKKTSRIRRSIRYYPNKIE